MIFPADICAALHCIVYHISFKCRYEPQRTGLKNIFLFSIAYLLQKNLNFLWTVVPLQN